MKKQIVTKIRLNTLALSLFLVLSFITVDNLWAKINIMPLGDSITYDNNIGETRPDSERTGYRQPLWLDLLGSGYDDVDFVGSLEAGQGIPPPNNFDPDNEGHSGFQILTNINGWLATAAANPDQGPVDVVLLHIGTNDLTAELPANVANEIGLILDNIDQYDGGNGADIWVILARIINRAPIDADTTALNNAIQSLADTRIAAGDKIIVVNMENKLVYSIDQTAPYIGDMWDALHPNASGYDKMATTWFDDGLFLILPVADAGPNRSVFEGNTVQLDGTFSNVPQVTNGNFSIVWNQTAGPIVSLANADTLTPTFTAPAVSGSRILQFRLTIRDEDNTNISDDDTIEITVTEDLVSTVSNGAGGGGGGCFIQTVSDLIK